MHGALAVCVSDASVSVVTASAGLPVWHARTILNMMPVQRMPLGCTCSSQVSQVLQVLLVGAGWEHAAEEPEAALKLLRRMPLLKLMPCGYLVVWGNKWTLQPLMRWLAPLNFRLVENMGWVRRRLCESRLSMHKAVLKFAAPRACLAYAQCQ